MKQTGKTSVVVWAVLAMTLGYAFFSAPARSEQTSQADKAIVDLAVETGPDSVQVVITGNQHLSYTTVKQSFPLGLALYFSHTALNASETAFMPDDAVISSVKASATESTTQPGVKVEILLKKQAYYELKRQGKRLIVHFSRGDARQTEADAEEKSPPAKPATRLETIHTKPAGNALKVIIGADGTVTNYKSYIVDGPARIIFDLFGIQSPYESEQMVPVDTPWVSRVRYYGYQDRLRIVLDTQKRYLSEFSAQPTENGLEIHVGEGASPPMVAADQPAPSPAPERRASPPPPPSVSLASAMPGKRKLRSVHATQKRAATLITVQADGPIRDYKSYTTAHPPTIIYDIFDIGMNQRQTEVFPVGSQWVERIRHVSYPDRLRLFIETKAAYIDDFSDHPIANGLTIRVGTGAGPQVARQSPSQEPGYSVGPAAPPPPSSSGKAARVENLDFVQAEAGKSRLVVNTNQPVRYEVRQINERELKLILRNTRLPKQYQRPLITSYFESAVDQITPMKGDMPNAAVFRIRLRESVPYFPEQSGTMLSLNFEASSIAPDAFGVAQRSTPSPPSPSSSAPSSAPSPSAPPPPSSESPQPSPGVSPPPSQPAPSPPSGSQTGPAGGSELDFEAEMAEMDEEFAEETPRYTGEKIALDFFDTDIRNVFRILREVSGKNFAVDKDVTGKVTLSLEHPVPWDQVLDLILKMNNLGKDVEGNIIRIATQETLTKEEEQRRERRLAEKTLQQQEKELAPLTTEYIPVSYSDAGTEIKPHIESILTPERGSVSVDARTNVIIMTDTAEKIQAAKMMVKKLDRVTPQVMIEARIVEASSNFSREIGTQWGTGIGVQSTEILDFGMGGDEAPEEADTGVTDTVADNVSGRVGVGPERGYNALGGTYGYNMSMNFPVAAKAAFGINFMRIAGTPFLLNAKLMAMESQGEGKIVSAPKVVTLDNKEARISQGLKIPYNVQDESGNTITEFEDVDLELKVTPHVTPDDRISMKVELSKEDVREQSGGAREFASKEAQTELLVNDGDTVVIGGIMKVTEDRAQDGVPGLSKIPLLGWLFKSETKSKRNEELLIFLTPRILRLEQREVAF